MRRRTDVWIVAALFVALLAVAAMSCRRVRREFRHSVEDRLIEKGEDVVDRVIGGPGGGTGVTGGTGGTGAGGTP
jgi:hypothetical protein